MDQEINEFVRNCESDYDVYYIRLYDDRLRGELLNGVKLDGFENQFRLVFKEILSDRSVLVLATPFQTNYVRTTVDKFAQQYNAQVSLYMYVR
jgi:hypothetical protein